ncbi:MAG: DoxX family protein [Deltaproteobacteria bacterium]|nr:MAG: DoxX family protein [Deltaproteobacteria bacterium]
MTESIAAQPQPARWVLWTGRVLSAIPFLMMLLSAAMKITRNAAVVATWNSQFGFPFGALEAIGIIEAVCAILYVIPRTAVLGAILVTGYLGGAVATHTRMSDPALIAPFILGVMAWAGLYLREPRLHSLLPLRKG